MYCWFSTFTSGCSARPPVPRPRGAAPRPHRGQAAGGRGPPARPRAAAPRPPPSRGRGGTPPARSGGSGRSGRARTPPPSPSARCTRPASRGAPPRPPRAPVRPPQRRPRAVRGERLGGHRRALHVGRGDLVTPPLVRHLVRGDEVRVVDVVRAHVGDEADGLGVGNGVVERLRELGVARELQDAHLPVLVGAELAR